jgi:Gram-negative bacterial TonB protein C-terminal
MANSALIQDPEAPHSASAAANHLRDIDDAQLLELRTENGAVYLRPSRWQRIRLQWTFRHFHVLSPQVLSRADKRLVAKLSQSAVVTPALPVASRAVLGVVETMRSKAPASANRVVMLRPALPAKHVFLPKPRAQDLPRPDLLGVLNRKIKFPGGSRARGFGDLPFQQWRELGALAGVGLMVILAAVYGAPLFSSTVRLWSSRTPIEHAANKIKRPDLHPPAVSPVLVSPAAAWIAKTEKPKRWIAPPPLEPKLAPLAPPVEEGAGQSGLTAPGLAAVPVPAPATPSAASARRFVAELPPGYFAHPVVSGGSPVGELQLRALIGADGSVREVTVLSGSRKLAEAGMRAVRQWHYNPYLVQGSPVEVETQIKMSFFGPDAVSIASVANGSSSQPK